MTTKERIKMFIDTLDYGRNKFEEVAGLGHGYVSSKSPAISSDALERIAAAYPDLSMEWLIRGTEPMLLAASSRDSPSPGETVPAEDFARLVDTIRIVSSHYERMKAENDELRAVIKHLKSA